MMFSAPDSSRRCTVLPLFPYANSLQFCRLWEHESQLYGWTDLLCVLRTIWYPAQHGGAQQGGQVHACHGEEHL